VEDYKIIVKELEENFEILKTNFKSVPIQIKYVTDIKNIINTLPDSFQIYKDKIKYLEPGIRKRQFGSKQYEGNDFGNIFTKLEILIPELIEELEVNGMYLLDNSSENDNLNKISNNKMKNTKIFIVHGHNKEMLEKVENLIYKIKLDPIILNNQLNQSDTIIEKLEANSDVHFAIVILSKDDYGYSLKDGESKRKYRARQNVIFELGYFFGKLGRKRTTILMEDNDNFEIMSDNLGIAYISYSDSKWEINIAHELNNAGFNVDYSNI